MPNLLAALAIVSLLLSPVLTFAQETTSDVFQAVPSFQAVGTTGNLQCFDYYKFGSIEADLQTNLSQTVPGSMLTFAGVVQNNNPYPVVDGTLYVKIFKRAEATFSAGDGNEVVDQFVIARDLNISANGNIPVSYEWLVPQNAEGGEYYAAYFFATNDRYNLLGLSFTDDVVGNTADFSVAATNTVAKLSKTETTLNNRNHNFAAFPLSFSATETVTVRTTITNPTDEQKIVPVQWNQFAWDAMNEANRRHTQTEVITLAPNETKEISYTAKEVREPVVYITTLTDDRGAKSFLNIRYVREDIAETRINFPGITQFPLQAGVEQTLFACAHSTNVPLVPGNVLTLTLTDREGNQIHSFTYEGDIAAAMSGFGNTFIPDRNYNYVLLTAKLEREGVVVEEVQIEYDCTTIPGAECLPEPEIGGKILDTIIDNWLFVIGGAVLLISGVLLGVWLFRRYHLRHENVNDGNTLDQQPPITPMAIVCMILLPVGLLFFSPGIIEAKSVQWNWTGPTDLYYRWDNQTQGFAGGWALGLTNPAGSITYGATLINRATGAEIADGSSLPINTEVCVQPRAHQSSDIAWFATGASMDSPNGDWIPNANSPGDMPTTYRNSCDARYYVGTTAPYQQCTGFNCQTIPSFEVYVPLAVNPPTKTFSASANMQDIGGGCYRLNGVGSGTANVQVNFSNTFGRYYYRYYDFRSGGPYNTVPGCYRDTANSPLSTSQTGSPTYELQIPQQSISYTINVTGVNNPPTAPTIAGAVSSRSNRNENFTFTGSDPNNDMVRYGVDWDNNGSVDQWAPGSGYVNSGAGAVTNRSWPTTGSYTFQALTEDSNGARSGWTSHTISISNNCVIPAGATTPYGTEATIIDTCALTAQTAFGGGLGFTRPADFTSAYVIYQDSWTDFMGSQTGERLQVCHNSTNPFLMTMSCNTGGSVAGVFTPQAQCTPPTQQCNFNASQVDLKINSSDGPLTVTKANPLVLDWTHDNAGTCTIYGAGLPGGQLTNVSPTGSHTIPGGTVGAGNETYVMTCTSGNDSVSLTIQNQNPNPPTITGPTSASAGNNTTFMFTGADPDNDQIFYEVDWDNNGTVDASTPASSYVNSGTTMNGNRSWPTPGTYTFQVRVVDFDNARSPWTQHSIIINPGPPPTATLEVQVDGGSWGTSNPSAVDTNSTLNLRWSSTRATSCTGTNFNTSGASNNNAGLSVATPAPGGSVTFTLACTGSGGTDTKAITVSVGLPNFNQPIATHSLSTGFDPATGEYDYVDITFQTTNDGQSGTISTAQHRLQFGSRTPVTGTIPLLTRGESSPNFTERINDVQFGTYSATITVDSGNTVPETNEGDNTITYNFGGSIPPPDPGLSITVSQPVVRAGETVTVTWNTNSTYPMNCTVLGPGLGSITFDPSVSGANGSRPSQSINAKSEFTLRCIEPITNTTFTDTATVEVTGTVEEI